MHKQKISKKLVENKVDELRDLSKASVYYRLGKMLANYYKIKIR